VLEKSSEKVGGPNASLLLPAMKRGEQGSEDKMRFLFLSRQSRGVRNEMPGLLLYVPCHSSYSSEAVVLAASAIMVERRPWFTLDQAKLVGCAILVELLF
jgi:hypothetical protein